MAEYKIQQRVYNEKTKEWDKVYPKVTADQVIEDDAHQFVSKEEKAQISAALPKSGGTMTGTLTLSKAPESDQEAATKSYVDRTTQAAIGALTQEQVPDLDAGKIKTGKIDIERLPAGALERCIVVKDDAARLRLTAEQVQVGDTVKVTASGQMYFVVDGTKLDTEAGYEVYGAGTAASVPWSGVTEKPDVFPAEAHTHTSADFTADDAHQFVSSAEKAQIEAALPKSGGIMTGSLVLSANPTLPKEAATKEYVDEAARVAAAAIIDGSPEALDTLKELSTALGDDPNFATTIAGEIGKKLASDEVVAAPAAGKILRMDANGKLPTDITGNAAAAGRLKTAVKVNGVTFDGSADINITQIDGKNIATTDQIGAKITISASAPENAYEGELWFEVLN